MGRIFYFAIMIFAFSMAANAQSEAIDSTSLQVKDNTTFLDKVVTTTKKINNYINTSESGYYIPSYYWGTIRLQETLTQEWMDFNTEDFRISMHSKMSSKIGPYFKYAVFGAGYSIDFSAMKGSKKKVETTLSMNNNLLNVDFIYRRTGGDFQYSKLEAQNLYGESTTTDLRSLMKGIDLSDMVRYSITGVNINYFLNHKKFSNSASNSGSSIQLRSAGSPIIGLGFTVQKLKNGISDVYFYNNLESAINGSGSSSQILRELGNKFNKTFETSSQLSDYLKSSREDDLDKFKQEVTEVYNNSTLQPSYLFEYTYDKDNDEIIIGDANNILLLPSTITISDWHVDLGYAYNFAFSPHWLLGVTVMASPGIKSIKYNYDNTVVGMTKNALMRAALSYTDRDPDNADYITLYPSVSQKHFGYNFSGRISLMYNYDRWRVGLKANANALLYRHKATASDGESKVINTINSYYGSINLYVGYNFSMRKQYRKNGSKRKVYEQLAR